MNSRTGMHSALTEAKAALAKAQEDMTPYYNQRRDQRLSMPRNKVYWTEATFGPPDHPRS